MKSDDNMNKKGVVYRYIAEEALKDRKKKFNVRGIAREMHIAPDTVSNAVAPLKRIGAVEMHRRYFTLNDLDKLLAVWAVSRELYKDVIYKTYVKVQGAEEIEGKMPSGIAYTNYSGYVKLFGNDASSYSEVYVYATAISINEIKKRFPQSTLTEKSDYCNLIVLNPDYILAEKIEDGSLEHSSVSMPQLYVDLWNTKEWYAYEFLKRLKPRIDEKYASAVLE